MVALLLKDFGLRQIHKPRREVIGKQGLAVEAEDTTLRKISLLTAPRSNSMYPSYSRQSARKV